MLFQTGAALLDLCVLAVLSREDTYGYVLTQQVRKAIAVSESALYPVLRRLQKEGCLSTYDQPYLGRNRRYYAITDQGRERFYAYRDEWGRYKLQIDQILSGGNENEQG